MQGENNSKKIVWVPNPRDGEAAWPPLKIGHWLYSMCCFKHIEKLPFLHWLYCLQPGVTYGQSIHWSPNLTSVYTINTVVKLLTLGIRKVAFYVWKCPSGRYIFHYWTGDVICLFGVEDINRLAFRGFTLLNVLSIAESLYTFRVEVYEREVTSTL